MQGRPSPAWALIGTAPAVQARGPHPCRELGSQVRPKRNGDIEASDRCADRRPGVSRCPSQRPPAPRRRSGHSGGGSLAHMGGGRLSLPAPGRATETCNAAGAPAERRTRSKGEHREALRSWLACGVHVETKQARRWKLASPTRPFAIRWRRLHAQNPPCASHASWTAAPEARSPWRSQNERRVPGWACERGGNWSGEVSGTGPPPAGLTATAAPGWALRTGPRRGGAGREVRETLRGGAWLCGWCPWGRGVGGA